MLAVSSFSWANVDYLPCTFTSDNFALNQNECHDAEFPLPVEINDKRIEFGLDDHYQPCLILHHQTLSSLNEAIAYLGSPNLYQSNQLKGWAIIINFLINGLDYQYIDDVEQFKNDFKADVKKKQSAYQNSAFSCYTQQINIDEIEIPRVQGDDLIFYIHQQLVPYRMIVSFTTKEHPQVQCQILSYG